MTGVHLSEREEEELYVVLKCSEDRLPEALREVLRRLEKALFGRLTVEEMERLVERSSSGR